MTTYRITLAAAAALGAAGAVAQPVVEESAPLRAAPAEAMAAAYRDSEWEPPRTSWGHPSLDGVWTTDDLRSVPLQRPEQFGMREHLTEEEFSERAARDSAARDDAVNVQSFLQHEWGVRTFGYTSLVVDPPNGRVPQLTEAGQALAATRNRGTYGPGPFNDFDDFTLFDRCITRGVVGSIMPVLYGNGVRIAQSPNEIAISYEMIHDTRIIPLHGRPHIDGEIKQWLGNARGYWEGDTLVVETANFTDRTNLVGGGPNSEALTLTERIRRVDPDMIEYVVTVNDPVVYEAPYTLRLMLTAQPEYSMLEYSCHEGNGAVVHALSGERAYEKQVEEALANGLPIPERATDHSQIRDGVPNPEDVIDINAGGRIGEQ